MIKRIRQIWHGKRAIESWLRSGGMLVDYHIADLRVDTCKACPKNRNGDFWDWIVRLLAKRIRIPKRSKHEGVKTCSVCRCPLRVKVQMPLTNILLNTTAETIEQLPPACWIITEAT